MLTKSCFHDFSATRCSYLVVHANKEYTLLSHNAMIYSKINLGMSVSEHVHAFQVVKSALQPFPVDMRLILDAIGVQLNCSATVKGPLC